jgi:hypothetical protein
MKLFPAPLIALLFPAFAGSQTSAPALQIPPIKTSIDLNGQAPEITAWGTVSPTASGPFALALTVDLGSLQDHLTPILAAQLNRSEQCGERLTVEYAALAPEAPSGVLTATVNYERYACAKAFGKQVVKRLVGGHGVIEVKLTPEVADNNISLDAAVRKLDADGSLGALLRSGELGDTLRQDIGDSVESAIQKAADLKGMLPAALQNAVTIRSVQFSAGGPSAGGASAGGTPDGGTPDGGTSAGRASAGRASDRSVFAGSVFAGGAGRLWLTVAGEVRLSAQELRRALAQ